MIIRLIKKAYNIIIYRPLVRNQLQSCGKNFKLGYDSELRNAKYFSIGDNFFSGPYGYFVTNKSIQVKLGNHIMFGPFCKILGGNHNIRYTGNHLRFEPGDHHLTSQIVIEDGAWVAASVTILDKAYIGEGAIIATNSVVNSYIPPYCVAMGSPARKFKKRMNPEELKILLGNIKSKYSYEEVMKIHDEYSVN